MRRRLCESCHREPARFTVFRASRAGRREERSLCETCARDSERMLFGDSGLLMMDCLDTIVIERAAADKEQHRTKVCSCCGNTVGRVADAAEVGCSLCYVVFRDEVARVIQELHGLRPGDGKPV